MHRLLSLVLSAASLSAMSASAGEPQRVEVGAGPVVCAVIPVSPDEGLQAAAPAPAAGDRASWHLQQTLAAFLKSVAFADPMTGYIAAELGRVYKTVNGGQSWTSVMNLGFPYYWYGVEAFTPETALIVGFQNASGAGVARWTTTAARPGPVTS